MRLGARAWQLVGRDVSEWVDDAIRRLKSG